MNFLDSSLLTVVRWKVRRRGLAVQQWRIWMRSVEALKRKISTIGVSVWALLYNYVNTDWGRLGSGYSDSRICNYVFYNLCHYISYSSLTWLFSLRVSLCQRWALRTLLSFEQKIVLLLLLCIRHSKKIQNKKFNRYLLIWKKVCMYLIFKLLALKIWVADQ